MNELVIQAEKLSKRYRIGRLLPRNHTLRDQLVESVKSMFRRDRNTPEAETLWALRDVSFEVRRGEIVGLIGRNGAGKSTLLKILARITNPTEGWAKLRGRIGSLLEVGTGFHSELTGRENIYLSGAILGMSKAEIDRQFDAIVEFAETQKAIDTPVKRYSSGMYVRLAFAVAAHLDTEILLVDEVLAVGDAAFQRKCLNQMGNVANQEGRTVVFVSHNMAMIQNLCTRAILLTDGKVAAEGDASDVIGTYLADLSQASAISIADRKDRQGALHVRATALELLDERGQAVGHPVSGQHLVFRLHYRCEPGQILRNCRVSVDVNKTETPFFVLSTDLVNKTQLDLEGEGSIDFVLEELPLSAGTYDINTYIQSGPEVQDWMDRAAEMTVIDGDFYGTGRNYPPGWRGKTVLVKHRWTQNS